MGILNGLAKSFKHPSEAGLNCRIVEYKLLAGRLKAPHPARRHPIPM